MTTKTIDLPSATHPPRYQSAKRVGAREARNHFADLLDQVRYSGDPVIIERAGKPVAAMIPMEMLERVDVAPPPSTSGTPPNTLHGAFPELAAISNEDLVWAKTQWQQGLENQIAILTNKY